MDTSIRSLLIAAQKTVGQDKNPALQQAYSLLRNVAESKPAVDTPESFSPDLYVLCAEIAFQNGLLDMAKECLKMYFMKPPPGNQFLCRAYLCQAQLLAPTATNPDQLEKAVVYLVKAISFAKENSRYHFLVYNASVIYWQFCRPFLKHNFRQYLARSLHAVVKALDDIDDKDYEWRAQLMIALIECNLDGGKKTEASQIAATASSFIKQNVPHLYKQVFGLIVRNQLIDSAKLHKDVKSSPELAVFYQICKLKVALENTEPKEYYAEIQRILNQMGVAHTEVVHPLRKSKKYRPQSPSSSTTDGDRSASAVSRRGSITSLMGTSRTGAPTSQGLISREVTMPSREISELSLPETLKEPPVVKSKSLSPTNRKRLSTEKSSEKLRIRSRSPLARSPSFGTKTPVESPFTKGPGGVIIPVTSRTTPSPDPKSRKSPTKGAGRRTPTPVSVKKIGADSAEKPFLLLELARLCLELDFPDLAQDCADHMKACNVKEQGFYLELEFLGCEIMVKNLTDKQESLQRNVVDIRLQAIKRCEEAIMNAIRLGNPNVLQVGCVTQWNLCLPLLQPNLRHYVRKPLTQVAEALENIQSLLVQLRCQIHTELSKCEEDQEQIEVAMDHLKKALSLDDANIYKERLEVMLHRLELRSELYKQPERPEDIAGMIIEQARKANSGTMRMKRSLLVKAGEALAPDAFLLVLDSESDTKDVTGGKAPTTIIKKLSNKARQFNKCVKKAKGHLQRLGDENDRERARLWGDLAKTARKQEVWDVCRVAARFCLLYDDNRWKNVLPEKFESPKPLEKSKTSDSALAESQSQMDRQPSQMLSGTGGTGSRPTSPTQMVPLYDKDLIRMFAEVNFIQGEAMVHLIRSEGIELNDMPIPPVDKSKRPKGYVAKKPEEDPDWIEYCDWIKSISECATNSFLRGLDLGVDLEEAWLVCCATAYIWNYNNHILTQLRHREIMPTLTAVYNGLKKVGHAGETMSLVNVCNALSYALMKPWIPLPAPKEPTPATTPAPGDSPTGKKKPDPKGQKNKSTTGLVTIAAEATPDLKQAIEVCEYAMEVTGGGNSQDVVPIQIRMPILQTWVNAKQMAQQQITRNLGIEEEPFTEGQKPMSRSIVAVEMLTVNKNGILEFKETPAITEIANMVEECRWTDKFVELQLWTRLTALAYDQKLHNLVLRCSKKALRFSTVGTQPKHRVMDKHRYMVEQEMLSYSSGILGQSLIENMAGKNAIRREALEAFLKSARFAGNADNYEMVMTAARHYWNASCPLLSQPIERELLREPIRIILQCITDTAEKLKKKEEKSEGEEEKTAVETGTGGLEGEEKKEEPEKTVGGIGAVEDDLTLRAALYGVLFQSYTDKGEWEEGLRAMDQAINDMPRTKHRLLIFKHRVMTKAKLGRSVAMDIQKFKDESEDYVAHMWRRVALSSKETAEQLLSYQNAIEALNSPSNEWLKVELLIEFGQWLCVKDFPLQDSVDQLEWAIDIMLNMQVEADARKEEELKAAAAAAEAKKAAAKVGKKDKKGPPPKPQKPLSPKKEEIVEKKDAAGKIQEGRGSVQEGDANKEGVIPIVKEAVIGVLPAKPDQKVEDISDIKILDGLIRAHILIAEIIGRGSNYYVDYLLMAHAYLMRLWQVTVPVTGPTMKEIAKNPPAAQDSKDNQKGSAKKKGDKGAEKAPAKEKPKRKGPLDTLPHNVEEWAVYDVPDEVIEAFKHDFMVESGINSHTITKPLLMLYYLESLAAQLRELGYNHLTLPVLAFEDLLSRDLLPSEALKFLVHTRVVEVCQELNLKNGTNFHEKVIGRSIISENDQALSRDEIAMWKEKQAQVIKEELRVRETIAKLDAKSKASTKGPSKQPTLATVATNEPETKVESHLGKILGAVTFRDVWTDTAEVLIRQGHYQSAREFLNEAHTAAVSFEDVPLQARILYLLGTLSLEEAQYGQAVNLCKKAQALYYGDEQFWYDTTMLMVEATLQDYENRKAKRVARGILVYSLNEFTRIMEERPNQSSMTGHVIAMFEYKLASTQWSIVEEECPDLNVPKVMMRVHEVCEKYEEATNKLLQLGYRREALPVMKEHTNILHRMAKVSLEKEIRHTYYLQAMMVLKEAVSVSEDVMRDIQTLYSLQEIRQLSLPIQREVADVKIRYGEIMLEIFRLHAKETKFKQLEDQRKGSVLKMVEDFIRATPDYTHMEKEWEDIIKVAIEDGVMKFVDAHNLAGQIPNLKARALCGVGQCLRALSTHESPDPPLQWIVQEMELAKISHDDEEEEADDEDLDQHSRHFLKYAKQIREMKVSDSVSRHYLVQATECLVQSLNMALQKKYTDVAATAALELVECFGQFDPAMSSQFLALFQSCETSLRLEELLNKAQLDPIESKLAALLRQRSNLMSRDITYNTSSGSVMSTVQGALENDWQAWKKMEILPTHLDLLKEFPSNFNFIILQHSPDKSFLYGAVLDKPKGISVGGGDKKGNTKQSAPAPSRAKVFGIETSPRELDAVLTKCRDHRQNVQQLLLKQEYQRSQAAMRQKMLENLDDSVKGQKPKTLVDESEKEERQLQDEFRDVVMNVEMYLKPLLTQIDEVFIVPSSSPATSSTEKPGKEKEPPTPPQEYAIILADPELMELPLEAARAFTSESIVSLSRDFSLQLFYHRYHQETTAAVHGATSASKKGPGSAKGASAKGASAKGAKGQAEPAREDPAAAAKKAKAKGGDQPNSRIPGLRDASKKMAKIIPLNRPLNPYSQPVDTMNFRFIVDPHLDCAETEENKPIVVFNKVLELYEQQFTPRWLGVMGDEHAPSIGEWEIYLIENSSFIFYGMEKLMSYLPPHKLSALNIPDCMIVYLLDMAQTTKSFTRQSKVDVLKSSKTLALEKPVETAMLTSLTGVKCIIGNQWYCTLAENASKLNTSMKDLLEAGMSTGEALRMLFAPYRRKLPESEETEEAEDGKSEAGKSQDDRSSHQEGSITDRSQASTKTATTERDYKDNIDVQRSWFNLVCYGLPNLVVTQI